MPETKTIKDDPAAVVRALADGLPFLVAALGIHAVLAILGVML